MKITLATLIACSCIAIQAASKKSSYTSRLYIQYRQEKNHGGVDGRLMAELTPKVLDQWMEDPVSANYLRSDEGLFAFPYVPRRDLMQDEGLKVNSVKAPDTFVQFVRLKKMNKLDKDFIESLTLDELDLWMNHPVSASFLRSEEGMEMFSFVNLRDLKNFDSLICLLATKGIGFLRSEEGNDFLRGFPIHLFSDDQSKSLRLAMEQFPYDETHSLSMDEFSFGLFSSDEISSLSMNEMVVWMSHPANAEFFASYEGASILEKYSFENFQDEDNVILMIYERENLSCPDGWEEVTLNNLKDSNFDINEKQWLDLNPIILEQVMKIVAKPIILGNETTEYLNDGFLEFAGRQGAFLWKALKFSLVKCEEAQKLVSILETRILTTDEKVYFLHWAPIESPLMDGIPDDFNVNGIPWHFLDAGSLENLLVNTPGNCLININSENDYLIFSDLIGEIANQGHTLNHIWKNMRPSADNVVEQLPNYLNLMLVVTESIPENKFIDAFIWAILTERLQDDTRIVEAKEQLFRHIKFSKRDVFDDDLFALKSLNAGLVERKSPEFKIVDEIFIIGLFDFELMLLLIERYPLALANFLNGDGTGINLVISKLLTSHLSSAYAKKRCGRIAESYIFSFFHMKNIEEMPFWSRFITDFPEELSKVTFNIINNDGYLGNLFLNEIFGGNELAASIVNTLFSKDANEFVAAYEEFLTCENISLFLATDLQVSKHMGVIDLATINNLLHDCRERGELSLVPSIKSDDNILRIFKKMLLLDSVPTFGENELIDSFYYYNDDGNNSLLDILKSEGMVKTLLTAIVNEPFLDPIRVNAITRALLLIKVILPSHLFELYFKLSKPEQGDIFFNMNELLNIFQINEIMRLEDENDAALNYWVARGLFERCDIEPREYFNFFVTDFKFRKPSPTDDFMNFLAQYTSYTKTIIPYYAHQIISDCEGQEDFTENQNNILVGLTYFEGLRDGLNYYWIESIFEDIINVVIKKPAVLDRDTMENKSLLLTYGNEVNDKITLLGPAAALSDYFLAAYHFQGNLVETSVDLRNLDMTISMVNIVVNYLESLVGERVGWEDLEALADLDYHQLLQLLKWIDSLSIAIPN